MKNTIVLILSASWILQGCAPLVIGGAATGAGVIHDRRSAGTVLDDKTLGLILAGKIATVKRLADNSHVNVTVYNGLALLTGEAVNEQIKREIGALVRDSGTGSVNRIANYLLIGPRSGFMNRLYDSKLAAKLKTVLFDVRLPGFDPTRVKVVTEHGVGFLMGILSPREAQAVVDVTRRVSGVRRIVTLFTIDDRPHRRASRSASAENAATGRERSPARPVLSPPPRAP